MLESRGWLSHKPSPGGVHSHVGRTGEIGAVHNDRGCDSEHDRVAPCGLGLRVGEVPGGTEMSITSKVLPRRVGWKAVAVGLGVIQKPACLHILEFP